MSGNVPGFANERCTKTACIGRHDYFGRGLICGGARAQARRWGGEGERAATQMNALVAFLTGVPQAFARKAKPSPERAGEAKILSGSFWANPR